MVSVLLIILKIIGITLLVIIGLLLLVLLVVLFVPVRYKFNGSYDEKFLCKGRITWLLHLVSVRIDVEEKVVTSVRILGIPLSVLIKKKDKGNTEETVSEIVSNEAVKVKQDEKAESEKRTLETEAVSQTAENGLTKTEITETEVFEEDIIEETKQTLFDRISAKLEELVQKIRELIGKIKGIFEKIKDSIINIKEKKETLERYLSILRSDTTKAAFLACKKRLFRMMKHIFPRKIRANITYGMSNPADTGYVLAVYGMLPGSVGKNIMLHADFDQQVFKGDFNVKGSIRAWSLLCQVLGVLMDKNCQRLFRIVKKEIRNERK